jgi:parallel beta-helix repeat protein
MREKVMKNTASFILISLLLASIFAGAMGGAGVGVGGVEENENLDQEEKGNDGVGNANVTAASSITCNSCEDCSNKLNGKYDMVILTRDLINVKGSCITFGANNVVFNGNGHKIDGDDTGEFESGITMSSKSGNTIKNCVITDFESGITLYGSSKNKIYNNEVSSNYYDGIWLSANSDLNNIHDNLIENNGNYGIYFSSNSNGNTFSKNTVCSNPTDIRDVDKNSGDENTCDTTSNWNDDGTKGCTYSCPIEMPDLKITDIICDSVNHRIGYKIKNVGDATASKGHYTTLFVDGAFQIKEQVNVNLAPGAVSQRYFDYYSWECTPPRDSVKVCADYGNFVDESNEGNNCREETCECVVEKPDLVITDIWNVSNTIYYKVKNQGKATAGVSYTSLSIDGVFKVKDYVASLASGATRTESFNYQWACIPPSDIIKVCADYLNGVAESKEKNNCKAETYICIEKPDLIITDIQCDSENHRISYKIKNFGAATASKGHYTTLFVDGAFKIKEQVYVDLAPGAVSQRYFDYYSWECSPPQDNVKVCADYGDFVDESNEKNNCREEMCECVVEKPDLVITDIWNVSNTIYYKVKNQGKATAGASYTSLSIDGVFKAKDYVAPLASGATRTESFNYQWACTPPSNIIKVCADYLNGVAESNENNNCKAETYVCIEKPDLLITDIQCDSENHRIGYKIKNVGDATASKGHYTTLFVDGAYKIKEQVNVNLAPGAVAQRYFDYYSWQCTPPQDNVKVCADYGDFVDESNEKNNCREETCECAPPEKPDLVITDVWNEDSTICYQVRNIGNATVPKGHYTALSIDGEPVVNDLVDVELAPKERLKRCFNYAWQCSPPDDTLTVCADYKDVVDEASEGNNCRNETWKCDNTPPVIVSGPVVSEVTQSSVTISWTTNEDSDSLVRFGRTAGKYEDQKSSLKMKQEHTIILKDLLPSTTYHYVVQSTDASENTVVSRDGLFETSPLPDDEDPHVSIPDLGVCKGIIKITAPASDNIGLKKVEFYFNEEHIFTDYSAPYELILNTTKYVNGNYTLRARASDLSGKTVMATRVIDIFNQLPDIFSPSFEMITPDDGDTVSEATVVAARATDAGGMDRIEFYIDDEHVHTSVSPSPEWESLYGSFFWGTYEVENGPHDIRVVAYDVAGNYNEDIVTVTVDNIGPRHRPDMVVRREDMTLDGSKFTIRLDVHNAGDRNANNVEIVDHLVGFQPTGWEHSGWDITSSFDPSTKECEVIIQAPHRFRPGVGTDVLYDVVPILTEDDILYQVGTSTSVSFDGVEGDHYEEELSIPTWVVERPGSISWHLVAAVDHAFSNADYLIVTNPSRLFSHYVDNDVNELLSSMASLGKEKRGVLGYLDTYSRSAFKNLIEPGGDWSSRLETAWTSTGYLLIVGETEIVPSRDIYDTGIRDTTAVDFSSGPVYPVTCVDNHYADISGSDNLPELIVGRIIGDSAEQLMTPIQTSLLDQFERTNALVVSGIGTGQDSFETNADEVADILDDEFTVDQMYGSDYANDAQRLTQFRNRARDKDVLYYRDHGSIDGWSHTVYTSNFPVDFGGSYPFAFGMVCLAGNYERDDDYNNAEAFLDSNTGVYIGATEQSSRSRNNPTGELFFDKWVNSPISIGQALKETKRELDVSDDKYRLWIMEYNLYGDPKYGASSAAASSLTSLAHEASQPPLSSLEVTIPDYEVTTIAGLDYVEIPEGQLLLMTDEPIVPYYVVSVDYAKGYEVQNVVLTERSGLVTATGLNLPTVIEGAGGDGSQEPKTMVESMSSGWYPEKQYRWQIIENPDGSTTLLIMMYPFYYNPLTTDVEFYRNYTFEIDYTTSTVEIAALTTDADAYQQGDDILIDLWLNNSGDTQDVIVEAVVRADSTGEVVDGLLLSTLKGFKGLASFAPHWNSSGIEPGYCFVEVTLKDTSGDVLDRKTERFRLGISSGEITNFTATPEYFDIGDDININMAFNNTGTVNITGTAITKIKNSTGYAVEEFRHNVTDLMPSESISFSDTWDTSGAEEGSYKILGYVLYDSTATSPATVIVTTVPLEKKPDLEIVKKWENWVDKEKGTYTVSYVVHNNGTTVAPAGHHTTLYIDEEAVEHKPVPVTLKQCDKYEDTFKTVVKCTPPGDMIMVCADNYDKVEELDEGNNCMTNVWQCPVPVRKPDLVIKDIKLTRMDGYCYVDYRISNSGPVSAAASTTCLYVDDKKVASDSTSSLAAGASRWDRSTYRTTGTHTYKVCADGPNTISETNEANNCRTEELTCPLSLDIYFADGGESPGSVYHYNTTTGIEETVYTRHNRFF